MHAERQANCVYVRGEVSVRTLNRSAYQQFVQLCRQPETDAVDFAAVERADSACISLLLAALRCNRSLKLQSLPPAVQDLAQLYEIESWINPNPH